MAICEATGKVRYRDRIAAQLALIKTGKKRHARRGKDEKRPYRCGACRGWHLTSWTTRWRK